MADTATNPAHTVHPALTRGWKLPAAVLILAALFRLWGTYDLKDYLEDEYLHVATARVLGTYQTTDDWAWQHPQLSGLILYGTIRLLGDDPVGWRSGNVFFGTLSVLLVFLLARLLFPGTAVPLLAMALLGLDPQHIYLSRTSFVEIMVTCFFLLYLYLLLAYVEKKQPTLPLTGVALGLTVATKAYFVFAIPASVLYAVYRIRERGDLSRPVAVDLTASLLLLPVAVYLLTYFWWFSRGYTLPEFFAMKKDAIFALTKLDYFTNEAYLEAGGTPWEWFARPLFWGQQRLLSDSEGIFRLQSNNPLFHLLVFPSLITVIAYGWKKRSSPELFAPLLFVGVFTLYLVAQRPMYSYSSTAVIPFAYLALARAVTLLARKTKRPSFVYVGFLLAAVLWASYLFPLLAAWKVPLAPFRPVLSMARYMVNF